MKLFLMERYVHKQKKHTLIDIRIQTCSDIEI